MYTPVCLSSGMTGQLEPQPTNQFNNLKHYHSCLLFENIPLTPDEMKQVPPLKPAIWALASVAQLECHPLHQKVVGSILVWVHTQVEGSIPG